MQAVNIPSKYLVPFATNDSAKVDIPVTTATVGRASQSLGFPPITGQPPETGGLPPQLEDFNGAVNQIARVAWWAQLGGQWKYDATFATDTNIGGYPAGAELQSVADNRVTWLSLVDNNVVDPDGAGTGWVPLVSYAPATITTAGGTTTPTLPIAAHETLIVSGTLSSNAVLILPVWTRGWTITNATTGAFTVTVKTAAGSGVVIPQNGAPTRVTGDGANITQPASNIAPATTGTQAAQFSQTTGRLLNIQIFTASGTYTPSAGTNTIIVQALGGGGGGGGCPAVSASQQATAGGGARGGQATARFTVDATIRAGIAVTIGALGTGGASGSNAGVAGGNTVFGTYLTVPGGPGGFAGSASAATLGLFLRSVYGTTPTVTGGTLLEVQYPCTGEAALVLGLTSIKGGTGGDSPYGLGGNPSIGGPTPSTQVGFGAGGGGAAQQAGFAGSSGGNGTAGRVAVYEYS